VMQLCVAGADWGVVVNLHKAMVCILRVPYPWGVSVAMFEKTAAGTAGSFRWLEMVGCGVLQLAALRCTLPAQHAVFGHWAVGKGEQWHFRACAVAARGGLGRCSCAAHHASFAPWTVKEVAVANQELAVLLVEGWGAAASLHRFAQPVHKVPV
jgi:hypothetical protein